MDYYYILGRTLKTTKNNKIYHALIWTEIIQDKNTNGYSKFHDISLV